MSEINYKQLGKKIRERRKDMHVTQEQLANDLLVNPSHISNIENNRVKISLPTLVHVCNALNTTIDYILADEYSNTSSAIEQAVLHELHSCSDETKEQILKIIKILH